MKEEEYFNVEEEDKIKIRESKTQIEEFKIKKEAIYDNSLR